jgi:hypothetical protein
MTATEKTAGTSVEFSYTSDDFVAGAQLNATPTRRRLLLAAAIAAAAIGWLFSYNVETGLVGLFGLPVAMAAGELAMWRFYIPWIARRNYARQPLAHLAVRLTLEPSGLRHETERGGNLLLWRDAIKWRANRKATLLYLSPRLFIQVPARLAALGFPADELRAILRRELGPPDR